MPYAYKRRRQNQAARFGLCHQIADQIKVVRGTVAVYAFGQFFIGRVKFRVVARKSLYLAAGKTALHHVVQFAAQFLLGHIQAGPPPADHRAILHPGLLQLLPVEFCHRSHSLSVLLE